MRPIAYTYEADVHCPDCARQRFPASYTSESDLHGVKIDATDNEGNPIHAVMPYDELPTDLRDEDGGQRTYNCGDCHEVIATRDESLEGSRDA